jgi:hypothetical protein
MINYSDSVYSTRELFVQLLVHPYVGLKTSEYKNLLGSLFNGDDGLKLGRPKYLSDQLWHKALLNSSQTNNNVFEAGSSASQAVKNNSVRDITNGLKIIKNNKYVETGGNNELEINDVIYCEELGRLRFDTKLVRNLTWLVNLQRIMRVIMVTHLSQINTPVVRGLKIANPMITEFDGNEKFEEGDYDGTNYDLV